MKRRKLLGIGLCLAAAQIPPLFGMDHDDDRHEKHGRKHGKRDDGDSDEDGRNHGDEDRYGYFRSADITCLRQYYTGPADLPPGLRKKYYRTGVLPPGWEKRFRPLPAPVIRQLPPPPPNCERGYVDGYAVVYDRRTRVIVDIMDVLSVRLTVAR